MTEGNFEPFTAQVGGHPGLLVSQDHTLIFKPSSPLEKSFYELITDSPERFSHIYPYVPSFYGVLTLQGVLRDKDKELSAESLQERSLLPPPTGESLVLENIIHAFKNPNVLDIKLGTILYDENAVPEKKERMLRRALETTSAETGIRLTGFQVYDNDKQQPVLIGKDYGRSLKAADLPNGIATAFPLSSQNESEQPHGLGLPKSLLLPVLEGILLELREIRDAVANTEMRFIGVSLLIAYEANWEAARVALDEENAEAQTVSIGGDEIGYENHEDGSLEPMRTSESSVIGDEDGVGKERDGEEDLDAESETDGAHLLYRVKLIDFAHSRIAVGEDTDTGVLFGLDTTIRLLEERLNELERR